MTEAAGTEQERVTLTEWHATFRKPLRVVEPDKMTEYEYDAQGREISSSEGEPVAATASSSMTTAGVTQAGVVGTASTNSTTQTGMVKLNATMKPSGFLFGRIFRKRSRQFNLWGLLKRRTAPNGANISFEYDKKGNRTSITDALGRISKVLAFDLAGRPLKSQDENGIITEKSYDKAGRLLKLIRNGLTSSSAYDRAGRLTKITYPDGTTTALTYTAAGKIASIQDAQGNTTSYTYDSNGNRLSATLTNATGQVEQSYRKTYDSLGRLSEFIDAAGQTSSYDYDANNNLTQVTDAKGRETHFAYDTQNRLTQTTDAAGGVTGYSYDSKGNLTQVKAPNGVTTSYSYDSDNLVTAETSADRGTISQTYDASGNVVSSTDAQGQTTTYSYDLLNRRTKTTWADGTKATYGYDTCSNGIGRLCTITDSSGATYYQYNSQGRVTRKDQVIGSTTLTQRYTYSSDGKLQTETLPSGAVIGYSYNQDQLSSVSLNGQTYLSGLNYNAAQNVTRWQWADGSTNQQTYDSLGRLQSFTLGDDTRTLSYDAVSNITGWNDQGANPQSKSFSYDVLDRLTNYQASNAANEAQAFEYDANGNRTAKWDQNALTSYLIEANSNRLVSVGNNAQQLDVSGNLLNDSKHLYTYNAQNRLANVDGTSYYTYNASQQRVKKATPQGTTVYAWSKGRVIGEYDANGLAKQETVYVGTTPIATIQQGKIYRIYTDQLNTPRVITDASGKTLWNWDSTPFGETKPNEDVDGDGIALSYNPRFPGQLYDQETGLHYNYHRDYNPETGRYVQSDPIGLAGGMNTFGYAYQNPYGYVDPDGRLAWFVPLIVGVLFEGGGLALEAYDNQNNTCGDCIQPSGFLIGGLPGAGAVARTTAMRGTEAIGAATQAAKTLCFTAGTLIHTKDGLKPIETIKIGDLVASRNDATGETAWKPVVRLFHNKDKEILKLTLINQNGQQESLGVTPEHPFNVVDQGWVSAEKLQVGTIIHSLNGQVIRVQSVERANERQDTYNFEVADYHTYFVGDSGVWVHNNCYDELADLLGNMTSKEFDQLASLWEKSTFDTLADSLRYHAIKHADGDLAKYLRQAANFTTKGASKTLRDDGSIIYKKNSKYIILRDGKIASYGGIND